MFDSCTALEDLIFIEINTPLQLIDRSVGFVICRDSYRIFANVFHQFRAEYRRSFIY